MATVGKNRAWIVKQQPVGFPVRGQDVELQERDIPQLTGDGQFLAKITWISLDPFLRGTMNAVSYHGAQTYPFVLTAFAVAHVIESRNAEYPVGSVITGRLGCQEYYLFDPAKDKVMKVPAGVKESHAVGVLGMPGATAYFGLLELGLPKEGETVLVSSAAGAVGSLVVQLGKLKGCRVVGFAGGKDKCDYVKELGADECIDYKGKSLPELIAALKAAAPRGVDVYFDNTGGPCTEAAFACVNSFSRVPVCGQIAYYNLTPDELSKYPATPMTFVALRKQMKIQGFLVSQFPDWSIAFKSLAGWLQDGKIKVREEVVEGGIEALFDALMTLFSDKGSNFGKLVVRL